MNENLPLPTEIPAQSGNNTTNDFNIYQFYKSSSSPGNLEIPIDNTTSHVLGNIYKFGYENSDVAQLQPNGTFLVKQTKKILYDISITITTSESCRLSVSLVDVNDNIYSINSEPVMYSVIKSSKSSTKNLILKAYINNSLNDVVKIMLNSYTNSNDPANTIIISSMNVIIN